MFGIGLPELIVILAVALIVVGPEKLPELAKTVAKQVLELKKAAGALKDSFKNEVDGKPWENNAPEQFLPERTLLVDNVSDQPAAPAVGHVESTDASSGGDENSGPDQHDQMSAGSKHDQEAGGA